jgi:Domain of unknown function (DUF4157)
MRAYSIRGAGAAQKPARDSVWAPRPLLDPACKANPLRRQAGPQLAPPIVNEVLRSSGRPLEPGVRGEMEARFGHDFSRVRVHADARAAQSARAVDAVAYTVGRHVVFDTGRFTPVSLAGKSVLTHELAHVVQQGDTAASAGELPIGRSDDPAEREAERVVAERTAATRGSRRPVLQRLGANPGCTAPQAREIHQAIFDARGWLNRAIPQLGASPLSPRVLASLRRNFGPTYGVAANAGLIVGRLRAAYGEISRIPIGCAAAPDAICAAGNCGYAGAGAGGHAATICTDVTLATADVVFRAGCVLHESLHAAFPRFTVDEYSGWHGHSGATAAYPGAGTDPLLNADSYTSLVIDLA